MIRAIERLRCARVTVRRAPPKPAPARRTRSRATKTASADGASTARPKREAPDAKTAGTETGSVVVPAPPPARLPPEDTAARLIPPRASLAQLRTIAAGCKACDLWRRGTQTVFGAGPAHARVMLVGEQPGNDEDLAGLPFVGPAGKLLDRALTDAGIDRRQVYVTNVVKHFKWEPRGKRRIHEKPNSREIAACRPWLEAEITAVEPEVVVCLGATAAQALLGRQFRVSRQRAEMIRSPRGPVYMATVHPSSILRAPDEEARHREYALFVADLEKLARWLHERHD